MTAKAIHDRLIEGERDFPASASELFFSGKAGKTPLPSKSDEKTPFDFADSEKRFTFAPTVCHEDGFRAGGVGMVSKR